MLELFMVLVPLVIIIVAAAPVVVLPGSFPVYAVVVRVFRSPCGKAAACECPQKKITCEAAVAPLPGRKSDRIIQI